MIEVIRHALDVRGRLPVAASLIAPWVNLYEMGLTPFSAIQVMLELEKEFSIEFPDRMLKRQNFATISSMISCIKQLRTQSAYSDAA
jgi:hypothetical protein